MKDNPYSKMLEIIKSQNKTKDNILIAEVKSPSPLLIEIGNLQIDKDNILMNDTLTSLSKGDKLAVITTQDRQLYIIVARVKGA